MPCPSSPASGTAQRTPSRPAQSLLGRPVPTCSYLLRPSGSRRCLAVSSRLPAVRILSSRLAGTQRPALALDWP
ncbi:hypothetical protein BGZ61DRAFT_458303, partial [Ilyonectria robusta]|uniref:uncharacterized protein n=1 Tax=Ilyonectria robusta TaxID=1079257 RepID=UPI001E8E1656